MLCGFFYLFVFIFGVHKNSQSILKFFFISLALILATFLLGTWQLQRLEWKNNLIKNFDSLKKTSAIELSQANIKEFTKIKVQGTINRNKKIFFPAKTLNGKVGLRISSEFTAENGNKYLLDEGWFSNLEYEYFRDNSDIFKENIIGYIRYPRKQKIFTPDNNIENNEWYTYDLKNISNFFSSSISEVFFIKKMSPVKENFLFNSNHEHQFRNNHLQYAITWFCMSLAFFIIFLVYVKKNNK